MTGSKIVFAHHWRLINDWLENYATLSHDRVASLKGIIMYKEGFTYHIKDDFFINAKKHELDKGLMSNKEGGNFRPTYYAIKDSTTDLLWVIPLSLKVEKYQNIYNGKVEKHGSCDTIVMGEYDGVKAAFLLQNMFPIKEEYIDHIHTRNGNPVPVKEITKLEINQKIKKLKQLFNRGIKPVFTEFSRLEQLMLHENQLLKEQPTISNRTKLKPLKNRIAEKKEQAAQINANREKPDKPQKSKAEER